MNRKQVYAEIALKVAPDGMDVVGFARQPGNAPAPEGAVPDSAADPQHGPVPGSARRLFPQAPRFPLWRTRSTTPELARSIKVRRS